MKMHKAIVCLLISLLLVSVMQITIAEESRQKGMHKSDSHNRIHDKEAGDEDDSSTDDDEDDSSEDDEQDDREGNHSNVQKYTWAEVQAHNQTTDCWIVLFHNVYDVTPLVQQGLTLECGTDQTELYKSVYGKDLTIMEPYFEGKVKGKPSQPPPTTPPDLAINLIPDQNVTVGADVNFTATASGGTAPRTFSLRSTAPAGATIDPSTGIFSWTPPTQGTFTFDVIVTDNDSATASTLVTITVNPVPIPTYTMSEVQAHNTDSDCWVVLFSKVYDITTLVTSHPGGNVFDCGTDMTALYESMHGTNVNRMEPYFQGNLA